MLTEKQIYQVWEKRFAYPKSPFKGAVAAELTKTKKITKVRFPNLSTRPVVLVGDDASSANHQHILLKQIIPQFSGKKILLVTNRTDPKVFTKVKKSKITIHKIVDTNNEAQTKKISQAILKNLQRYDHIIVWTGHLRLSDQNFQKKLKSINPFYVYLQSNVLRWRFPNAAGWNKINQDQIVWMDQSPLVSIDHYRSSDEKDFILIEPKMIQTIFHQMMALIAKKMGQRKKTLPNKIIHVFDRAGIKSINALKNKKLKKFIEERVLKGESAVMPREKLVLLSTLNSSHLAEEAAHYLRTANHRIEYGPAATLIEEALAFFASLILFPNRRIPAMKSSKQMWDQVHMGGYALGFQLWKMWKRSDKNKPLIRNLWKLHPANELEAQMMFQVVMNLK